uniref:DUF834 domain-containing protein n=1 Tax=Oryza glumipatula TaxID=40148 RepID=A0A0E0BII3_9ORYZ
MPQSQISVPFGSKEWFECDTVWQQRSLRRRGWQRIGGANRQGETSEKGDIEPSVEIGGRQEEVMMLEIGGGETVMGMGSSTRDVGDQVASG